MSDDTLKPKGQRGKGDGSGKRGKRKPKERHFMDAALDGYIRDRSLALWRDYVVYKERQEKSSRDALMETGFFGDRGGYAATWSSHWERNVLPMAEKTDGEIFGQIEASVRAAVLEEKAARKAAGGQLFEDTEDYNEFIRNTLDQLIKASSSESEPLEH